MSDDLQGPDEGLGTNGSDEGGTVRGAEQLAWFSRSRTKRGLIAAALFLVLAAVVTTQTKQGQDLALRAALKQVQSSLSGELTIQGVRSGTLLTGATMTGVRLDAEDGRPVFSADSVVVRYSILAALSGGQPIRATMFWGLDLEISRYTSEESVNLNRVLAHRDSEAKLDINEPVTELLLGQVGFRESRVRILTPTTNRSGQRLVQGPEGVVLRELTFDSLDIDIEEAILSVSSEPQFTARLSSLSSSVGVLEEPFVIEEALGFVSYGQRGITISEGRYTLPGGLIQGDLTVGPRREGQPWVLTADIQSEGWVPLSDIGWIDARIPEGRFRGAAELRIEDGVHLAVQDIETELEAGNVLFNGGVTFDEG
ncbi:MAG: hypothetical protein CMH51_02265, partial [Myxococcales bacterium]|nr:hypothetical protein [Myxococcales bacterium]